MLASSFYIVSKWIWLTDLFHSRQSTGGINHINDGSIPEMIAMLQMIILVVTPVFDKKKNICSGKKEGKKRVYSTLYSTLLVLVMCQVVVWTV